MYVSRSGLDLDAPQIFFVRETPKPKMQKTTDTAVARMLVRAVNEGLIQPEFLDDLVDRLTDIHRTGHTPEGDPLTGIKYIDAKLALNLSHAIEDERGTA